MNKRWSIVLAAGAGATWIGFAPEVAALTDQQRFERLERHMLELEKRLEASETENAQLRNKLAGQAEPNVKDLNQKVKIIERKLEVEQEIAADRSKQTPKIEAGANGFRISSPDGDHTLNLRGSVQADGKFFMDDNRTASGKTHTGALSDRFELKQARIRLEGTLFKYFDYKIMPEFGGGSVRLFDAYIDNHYLPYASLTGGKLKPPISLERLQGDNDFALLERAYPTYLAPNRDVGFMVHGEFAKPGYKPVYGGPVDFKNFFSYQVGVFNGDGDNGPLANTDTDDAKEFAGRVWMHPFQHSGIDALDGLGLGIAGSWQKPQKHALANLTSPNGQNTIVNYSSLGKGTSSLSADGEHYRIYPQAYWYYGPYGLLGEYALSSQALLGESASGHQTHFRQDNTSWQIQASYVLTGEDNTFAGVKPRENFDPLNGKWGAFQIATRWTELAIDRGTFANLGSKSSPLFLLDSSKSVDKATTWTIGANWFLNRYTRIMADYEQTYFDGGAVKGHDRPMEKIFSTRFQLAF